MTLDIRFPDDIHCIERKLTGPKPEAIRTRTVVKFRRGTHKKMNRRSKDCLDELHQVTSVDNQVNEYPDTVLEKFCAKKNLRWNREV